MDKKIAKRWIRALRSGEYKQGDGQLRNEFDNFCCLGVLCNIHAYDHPEIARQQKGVGYMGSNAMPVGHVREWAGLSEQSMNKLADLNDESKWSFKRIADYIEKKWENL